MASRVAAFMVLCALAWSGPARAGDVPANELPPRDVAAGGHLAPAILGALPSDFQRIEAGWLTLEFPGSVRSRVDPLVIQAEELRSRLSQDLGQPVLNRVIIRVARSPAQMAELAPQGAPPPAYASAVAYPSANLVLLSLQAPDTWEGTDLAELLAHELAHIALADAVVDHHVPLWFNEGFAIHESRELWSQRMATLWEAALSTRLLPLDALDQAFPQDRSGVSIAYAESADVVRFLMRASDRARFGSLIERVRGGGGFDRALEDAYGTNVRKLEFEWRDEASRRFGIWPVVTGGGFLWMVIVGLAGAAWIRKRRIAKAKIAQWIREESEVDAAMAAARAQETHASQPPETPHVGPMPPPLPVVEHEGRWYTLH